MCLLFQPRSCALTFFSSLTIFVRTFIAEELSAEKIVSIRKGQPGKYNKERTARKRQPCKESQDKAARIGWWWKDSEERKRTAVTRQQGQRQSGQDRQDRTIKTSTCKIFDKMKEIDPQLQVSIFNAFFLSTVQRQNNLLRARWILKTLHKRLILVRITVDFQPGTPFHLLQLNYSITGMNDCQF
jgi:hypothetical protein